MPVRFLTYARDIRATDTDERALQGQVLFSVDESETLEDSNDACMGRTDVQVTYYDETLASPMKYVSEESSRYLIEVPQAEGPVVFDVIADTIVGWFERVDLSEFLNENEVNSVTISAPNHPSLDGLKANGGSVSISNLDADEYEIELDLQFEIETDSRMDIQTESTLYMP